MAANEELCAALQRDWGKLGFFMSIAGTVAGLVPIIGSNVIIFITVPLLSNRFEKWHTTGTVRKPTAG